MTPSKRMLVALPRILGPTTAKVTLTTARTTTSEQRALRPQLAGEPAHGALEVLGLGGRLHEGVAARPAGARALRAARARRRACRRPAPRPPAASCPGARCITRLPPRRAARRRSRGTSRWSRAARRACRCRRWCRLSSTMIWSACMMVPTRWATMITVASAVCLFSAARSLASVVKSSAEKLSSKMWILACLASARAMARRWRWPPETLAPPWAICALELLRHLVDELAALRDLEVAPELLVGRLLVAVAQVAGHGAAEQERLLRHQADPAPQVLLLHLAHVTPSTSTVPPVTS